MTGIGHNRGPTMQEGHAWRRHCWSQARADILPHLPIEVLRLRVRRARELGLDYRTYASVRATTGHDVVAFLFSSNALRVMAPDAALPPERAEKLAAVAACQRLALAQAPLTPAALLSVAARLLDAAHPAPAPLASFAAARDRLRAALGRLPADGVLLVGDLTLERDWCAAGRLAGYLPAERYFAPV